MSHEEPLKKRKLPLVKISIVAAVLAVGVVLVLRGVNYRALVEQGMAAIRSAGPLAFFAGIVVLPTIGAPLTAFTVTAGEAFAPQMTLGGVIAAVVIAIAGNLALNYWLARYALRPLFARLAHHYGYRIPRVTRANALSVTLVFRLTPGIPFFMQSYILGLAEVPFRLYMITSWVCALPLAVGAVILGKGMFDGHFKMAGAGLAVIAVAVALVHWIRKRYAAPID